MTISKSPVSNLINNWLFPLLVLFYYLVCKFYATGYTDHCLGAQAESSPGISGVSRGMPRYYSNQTELELQESSGLD